jgi:hypothetical protein
MLAYYIPSFSEVGAFLGGLAAFLTLLFAIATWIFSKVTNNNNRKLITATRAAYQELLNKQLIAETENLHPEKYYTLDFRFPDGNFMHIPMVPNKTLTVMENIKMTYFIQDKESTIIIVKCKGYGHIPEHCHETSFEEVKIVEGTMTCVKTGKTYVKDDVWIIPPKEYHGAHLYNCIAIFTYNPQLPKASERPINLQASDVVFTDDE